MTSSEHYTNGYGADVEKMAQREAAFPLPHLNALGTNAHVIDCGCGPGSITIGITGQIPSGQVVGSNIGSTHIEHAIAHTSQERVLNVTFKIGSIYDLPYSDSSFDAAFTNGVAGHLGDPVSAIKEMRRVIREGGGVAVRTADVGTFMWSPTNDILDQTVQITAELLTKNGISPYVGRKVRGLMREAGLRDVVARSSTHSRGTAKETISHGCLWAQRFIEPEFAGRVVELGVADRATLERLSQA